MITHQEREVALCTRVRLVDKPETEPTSLASGDEGTAIGYSIDQDLLSVFWDNGSRLRVPVENVVMLSGRSNAHLC